MGKCNYVWILAFITRAVDDKIARGLLNFVIYETFSYICVDLMGNAFRTQLMSMLSILLVMS